MTQMTIPRARGLGGAVGTSWIVRDGLSAGEGRRAAGPVRQKARNLDRRAERGTVYQVLSVFGIREG